MLRRYGEYSKMRRRSSAIYSQASGCTFNTHRPDVEDLNIAILDHIRCHIGGTAVNQES